MAENEISQDEALKIILSRLRANESVKGLAAEIEAIIDQGTLDNVDQSIDVYGESGTKKVLKARSLTDKESLEVAVNLLRAYFLELPMIIASVEKEFTFAGLSLDSDTSNVTESAVNVNTIGRPKKVVIELETETMRFKDGPEMVALPEVSQSQIQSQEINFSTLYRLTSLGEE